LASFTAVTRLLAGQRKSIAPDVLLTLVSAHRSSVATLFRNVADEHFKSRVGYCEKTPQDMLRSWVNRCADFLGHQARPGRGVHTRSKLGSRAYMPNSSNACLPCPTGC
ncbi:hypothetical protein, partial [Nocardia vaccinii]|uniref:hypothetical protein n=1 Tax=Nocardia vaccinii TaxID=1822 RepID=UPI001C3FD926